MSLAAADVAKSSDDLLTIAVSHSYGSTEAFGRAFRAVHGVGLTDACRSGARVVLGGVKPAIQLYLKQLEMLFESAPIERRLYLERRS